MPIQGPQSVASDHTVNWKSLSGTQWLHSADYKQREALITKILRCLSCLQLNFYFAWLCSNCSFNHFNCEGGFIHPASNTSVFPAGFPKFSLLGKAWSNVAAMQAVHLGSSGCTSTWGCGSGMVNLAHGRIALSPEPLDLVNLILPWLHPSFLSVGAQRWQRDFVLPHLIQQHIQFLQIFQLFF